MDISPPSNKDLIINPDCYMGIIMEYIFLQAGISADEREEFDIATEKGTLLNVIRYAPQFSGHELFKEKNTYYIVHISEEGEIKPLLNKLSKEYSEFILYQNKKCSLKKRRSSASKSSSVSTQSKERKNSAKGLK